MTVNSRAGVAIDKLYNAIELGDLDAVMACFTHDARLWHCFDRIAQHRDAFRAGFSDLIENLRERRIFGIRRFELPEGLLQQHVMVVKLPTGERKAWPVCIIVRVEGDKIARIDEYIDRAGSFDPGLLTGVHIPGIEPSLTGLADSNN